MSSDLLVKDEPAVSSTPPAPTEDQELRAAVRTRIEGVRRLKLHIAAYVLGMLVLTPVWALTQWQTSGGFQRWSTDHSRPGDWEPWILYVALGWGLVVAILALKVYFARPTSPQEIERAVEREKARRAS